MLCKTVNPLLCVGLFGVVGFATTAGAQVTPVGPEFRVNIETMDDQQDPRVAVDENGNCAVVWESMRQDGSDRGVYLRIFDANGVGGPEILVPTSTSGRQEDPVIAMTPSGKILVVWEGEGTDGQVSEDNGIWGRRFDITGAPLDATQFHVNTTTQLDQRNPAIGMDSTGNFVVAWEGTGPGDLVGVFFQRFLADTSKDGGETPANATTAGGQGAPTAKLGDDGNLVIAWHGTGPGDLVGVFFQRFDSNDSPVGPETLVNDPSLGTELRPALGCDADGNFVVVWDQFTGIGVIRGVYARRYMADGTPLDSPQLVNTFVIDEQEDPKVSVHVDAEGNYVIVWESEGQDGDGEGVYAQRYASNGFPMGAEFPVNTTTENDQDDPDVAIDSAGNFIIAWESTDQDGDQDGVYAQRYQSRIRLVGTCACFWDNGEWDGDGQASVMGGVILEGGAQVADDFYLPNGKFYRLDTINALLLTNDETPHAIAEVYTDCNGKPDRLIQSFELTSWQDTGLSGMDEAALIEVSFDTSDGCWLEGGQMYWVSVYGVGETGMEVYYFASTGNGAVQGVESQFILPKQGFTSWTSIKETNVGKRDMAFSVCTTACDIVADNGEFDPTYNLPLAINQGRASYRAADNFVLGPCTDWTIDMIQLCVLTNCELTSLKLDIYETDPVTCMPYLTPVASFSGADKVVPLGISLPTEEVVPMTVDAYLVQFHNLDLVLPGGKTYWVGVGAEGTGTLLDRTFACFSYDCNKDSSCQVKISPAKFLKPSVGAWQDFDSFLGEDKQRELVFLVCARPERGWFRDGGMMQMPEYATAGYDTPTGRPETISADFDEDGVVTEADFAGFMNAYFSAMGPITSSGQDATPPDVRTRQVNTKDTTRKPVGR